MLTILAVAVRAADNYCAIRPAHPNTTLEIVWSTRPELATGLDGELRLVSGWRSWVVELVESRDPR